MKQFRDLKENLRHEPIKWVEEHNIHITLKFLGETEEQLIPAIGQAVNTVALATAPFSLRLNGIGIFGSSYQPRVVWAGIDPYEHLSSLMNHVHESLVSVGFERDRQNLVPHLTLGRIKFLRDKLMFRKTIEQYKEISSTPMVITGMILYESILKKEGPEYRILQAHPFNK